MEWIPYLFLAGFVIFMANKMLPVKGLKNLNPDDVKQLLKKPQGHVFVDVREPFEYKRGYIKGFQNIPIRVLRERIHELDRKKPIVLTCQSGMRSRQAAKLLKKQGFTNISHLRTGMSGWDGNITK
ncbi:rhodanese-like domain-containing protein [Brevibacillus thermoruber]|uniref:Rhodanese-like domain-containing protein n=1 Tax=Brevibacillus thermoruber TaxID=33942 RepID=A0A9X3TVM2_9BACL|nr:rhodanese-like domain-containing protein [Brevibacillus thermoruber]MDA5110918.1 rhodanese-like domain-containing protein [Brevibacillus thermoruber]